MLGGARDDSPSTGERRHPCSWPDKVRARVPTGGERRNPERSGAMQPQDPPWQRNRRRYGITDYEGDVVDSYCGPTFKAWNTALREGTYQNGMYRAEIDALQSVI